MAGTARSENRLAIVDDHFAIRDGYSDYLSRLPYVKEVECFSSSFELLEVLKKKMFHLVLMDIQLKDESGLTVCRDLKEKFPAMAILMVSTFHSQEYMIKAEQYKADGYIFKDSEPHELRVALEKILFYRERYFPPEAKEAIFDHQAKYGYNGVILTDRELHIIRLICEGKSNKQIGDILNREESTIAKHRMNIKSKLKIRKSLEILNYAIKHGIYNPGNKEST